MYPVTYLIHTEMSKMMSADFGVTSNLQLEIRIGRPSPGHDFSQDVGHLVLKRMTGIIKVCMGLF